MSDAPDGFLDNFRDGGSGVLEPLDGVRVLIGVPTPVRVGMLEALWIEPNLDVALPLAGLTRPVGVRGLELAPLTGVPNRLPEMLLCLLDVGVLPVVPTAVLRGMRLGVPASSVLSNDCVEP